MKYTAMLLKISSKPAITTMTRKAFLSVKMRFNGCFCFILTIILNPVKYGTMYIYNSTIQKDFGIIKRLFLCIFQQRPADDLPELIL